MILDIREFQQEFTKDLPTIYQQFTNNLPKMFGQKYFDTFTCIFSKIFSYSQLALQVLMKTGDLIVGKHLVGKGQRI